MKINFFFAMLAALAGLSFSTAEHKPWELLGARKINYALDRDEIVVTRAEGVFSAVQLRIKRSAVNIHKMAIHYGNGEVEDIDLRENFRAGAESRIIDLPGNKRIIKKVVLWYDTKNLARDKGVVELWGRH